jgi:uncharacterized protein (DUF1778 family)
MAKTITVRLDDKTYELIRNAAAGERRSISNFVEYATISYVAGESLASEAEMEEILNDAELMAGLRKGMADIADGNYTFVE